MRIIIKSVICYSFSLVMALITQTTIAEPVYIVTGGILKIGNFKCQNLTTGQEVNATNSQVLAAQNCEAAGLIANAYDHVVITIDATAQGVIPSPPWLYLRQRTLSSINLSWYAAQRATSYRIYSSESPGVTVDPANLLAEVTGTSYTHTNLSPTVTYYYVLTAVNDVGESAPSYENVYRNYDHTNVTTGCSNCHDDYYSIGKPIAHIASTDNCELCHAFPSFIPAKVDHTAVIGSCNSCHTDIPVGHIVTVEDCNTCHRPEAWTVASYVHQSSNYPGNHRIILVCTSCHQIDSEKVAYSDPSLAPYCAACHTADFNRSPHRSQPINVRKDCGQAGCHRVTDRVF